MNEEMLQQFYVIILIITLVLSIVIFVRWWATTKHIKEIRDRIYEDQKTVFKEVILLVYQNKKDNAKEIIIDEFIKECAKIFYNLKTSEEIETSKRVLIYRYYIKYKNLFPELSKEFYNEKFNSVEKLLGKEIDNDLGITI